jgi:hypothetical protein
VRTLNELWALDPSTGALSSLLGAPNALCVDVFGGAGPAVDLWACTGGANQQWAFDAQTRLPGESGAAFAQRVQRMIAARAGLTAVDWDGDIKYWRPSDKFLQARQATLAEEISGARGVLDTPDGVQLGAARRAAHSTSSSAAGRLAPGSPPTLRKPSRDTSGAGPLPSRGASCGSKGAVCASPSRKAVWMAMLRPPGTNSRWCSRSSAGCRRGGAGAGLASSLLQKQLRKREREKVSG